MAESVRCPECTAEFEVPRGDSGREVTCPRCDARFRPARPAPPARRPARARPRPGGPSEGRRAASQVLGTPAKLLQLTAALQLAIPLGILALEVHDWANRRPPAPNAVLPPAGFVAVATFLLLKDAAVLVGAWHMLKFRRYPVALAGAIAALWPIDGCALFSVIFGIWAIVALQNPAVRRAFAENAPDAWPDDEEEGEPAAPPAVPAPPAGDDLPVAEATDAAPANLPVGKLLAPAEASRPWAAAPRTTKPADWRERAIRRAETEVHGPAVVLLIAWLFGALFALCLFCVALYVLVGPPPANPPPPGERPLMAALGLVYPVVAALGLYGAVQMLRLRSYGWAMTSAILMMVSFFGCLLGLAVGIWAVVVLNRPDVARGFSLNRSGDRRTGTDDDD